MYGEWIPSDSDQIGCDNHGLDYQSIGQRVRQARKAYDLTLERMANKIGVSISFMGHIERGTRRMSLDTFSRLCIGLDLDPMYILYGEEGFIVSDNQKYILYNHVSDMVDDMVKQLAEQLFNL